MVRYSKEVKGLKFNARSKNKTIPLIKFASLKNYEKHNITNF